MASHLLSFRERILELGAESNLIGIVTEANPGTERSVGPRPARPMVIFLNAGVLHRVGPHRLHVFLARRLVQAGLSGLRLDLSGIGDSGAVPGELTFRASAVADTRAAMDRIATETGIERFVLFGLCSGADNALAAAQADPRVVGLVLIDAPAYATWRALMRSVIQRAGERFRHPARSTRLTLRSLKWRVRQLALRLGRRLNSQRVHGNTEATGRQFPTKAQYAGLLTILLDRHVKILSIYSGGMHQRFNHRDQLFEMFPRLRGRLQVAFFPASNHVFTELAQRNELIETITRWCDDNFA